MVCNNKRQSDVVVPILLLTLLGFASVVNSLKPSSSRPTIGASNAYLSQLEQQSRRQAERDVWPVASALASAISPLSALAMDDNRVPTTEDMHTIFRDALQNFEDMSMIFPLSNLDEKISAAIATAFAPAAASYYTQPPVGLWNAPQSVPGRVPTNAELTGVFSHAIDKLTDGLQMAYEKLDNLTPNQKIAATVAAIVISYPLSYEYYKYELREEERKAEQKRAIMKAKRAALAKKAKEGAEKTKKKKKSGVKGEKKKGKTDVAAAAAKKKKSTTAGAKKKKQAVVKGEKVAVKGPEVITAKKESAEKPKPVEEETSKPEPAVAVEGIPEPVAVEEMIENPEPVVAATADPSVPQVSVTIRSSLVDSIVDRGLDAYAAAYADLLAETESAAVPGDNAAAAKKSSKETETVATPVGGGTGMGSYLDSLSRRP